MNTTHRNPYIGHPSQLLRINDYKSVGGHADGIRATDIQNGLVSLTVCADKGMDFPYFSYKGTNLGFITPAGMVNPAFYDDKGTGFLRGFFAGFLTTCGILQMGGTCEVDGKHYGLHGRINNTPAQQYSCVLEEDSSHTSAVASGRMSQSVIFGENLEMKRSVKCDYGEKGFRFTDCVTNRSFTPTDHMILYHFNMGYPLLDENAELFIPNNAAESRGAHAQTGFDVKMEVPKPINAYEEMCYFYELKKDADGKTCVGIYNHSLNLGVAIHFDTTVLDHFTQWKMVGEGEYTVGLEPGNARPSGYGEERELGHVKTLQPGESCTYEFRIEILDGQQDLDAFKKRVGELR